MHINLQIQYDLYKTFVFGDVQFGKLFIDLLETSLLDLATLDCREANKSYAHCCHLLG